MLEKSRHPGASLQDGLGGGNQITRGQRLSRRGQDCPCMRKANMLNLISLYEAFEPAKTRRIWEKLKLHHTPKHGSWLNMAEIDLSAFTKECLGRRIGDINALKAEAAAYLLPIISKKLKPAYYLKLNRMSLI